PWSVRPTQFSQPATPGGSTQFGGAPDAGPYGPAAPSRPASPFANPRPFQPSGGLQPGFGGPGAFGSPGTGLGGPQPGGLAPGGLAPGGLAPGGFGPGRNPNGMNPNFGAASGLGGGQPGQPPPLGGYDSEDDLLPRESPFTGGVEPLPVPITVETKETQTGRLMFGVGVNSNAGLIGNVVIDEQNFNWQRWPRSWEDIRSGQAFRGGGQQFRIEAMPGTQLSRYGFTFRNPYLWDTRINFGLDAYYFNRYFQNWTEQRTGGRMSLGYQLTPDLSTMVAFRAENIRIFNPTVPTPPELSDVLGSNSLFSGSWTTIHDTRDSAFLPTQGHRVSIELEQAFGSFSFPRAVVGWRQHFLVYERPDGSGRQVLTLINDTGFTGSHTPIFENFFAGGYNTLRGFYFRGASPLDMGVQVGGKFEFLNTAEYMFPITADDSLRGVVFTDFGTVEPTTEIKWQDFRVAPGFGLRVTIPAMGPAPIALDFAFPVHKAPGDHLQFFNFFVGVTR
ncbi:MAG TPA: BamA/TamA family outer membrane protein, partial [Pirellulales bacterium]|nr:BamA/TamA family outer membrane protein [Pirellulales bacterium]